MTGTICVHRHHDEEYPCKSFSNRRSLDLRHRRRNTIMSSTVQSLFSSYTLGSRRPGGSTRRLVLWALSCVILWRPLGGHVHAKEHRNRLDLMQDFVHDMQAIQEEQRGLRRNRQPAFLDAEWASSQEEYLKDNELREQLWKIARPVEHGTHQQTETAMSNQRGDRVLNDAGGDDAYYQNGGGGVDLSQYAFKYIGCQNIHQWSDEAAAGEYDNHQEGQSNLPPLSMNRFVIFRLCESSSCSAYNKWGCNAEYGEYMIPMDEYLQIMSNYHMQQVSSYCTACKRCMTTEKKAQSMMKNNANNNDDGYTNSFDDDWTGYNQYWGENRNNNNNNNNNQQGNGGGNRVLEDSSGYADDDVSYIDDDSYSQQQNFFSFYLDSYGQCIYRTVCSEYQSACKGLESLSSSGSSLSNYFSCSQFSLGNDYAYVSAHCASDGKTIDLGMYADAYCNNYVGKVADIVPKFDDSELKLYTVGGNPYKSKFGSQSSTSFSAPCISCAAEESYSLLTDDQIGIGTVYPMCSYLYDTSAKCQRHMPDWKTSFQSEQQQANEDAVCDMIGALVLNEYDEYGEIIIQDDFDAHNWYRGGEYVKLVRKASGFQIFMLTVSITSCLGLFGYSMYLFKKLMYRKAWNPPINAFTAWGGGIDRARSEAGRLSRMHSGVISIRREQSGLTSVEGGASQTGGHRNNRYESDISDEPHTLI